MSALLHPEFKMMLMNISRNGETLMERDLANIALDLCDADPDNPRIEQVVNRFTKRALS
jgi:hypothetical protein